MTGLLITLGVIALLGLFLENTDRRLEIKALKEEIVWLKRIDDSRFKDIEAMRLRQTIFMDHLGLEFKAVPHPVRLVEKSK